MLNVLEQEVKQHVTQLFEQADTTKLYYHNYQHTAEVVERIEALSEGLNASELLLLKIAGWFHDVGYLFSYDSHEDRGMVIAADYLENKLVPTEIEQITACIEATKLSLEPRNLWEQIIKDADIGYGTTERFMETGRLLRKEWISTIGKIYSEIDWEILQYNFLSQVQYYTDIAQKKYRPILEQNILQQKKRL